MKEKVVYVLVPEEGKNKMVLVKEYHVQIPCESARVVMVDGKPYYDVVDYAELLTYEVSR